MRLKAQSILALLAALLTSLSATAGTVTIQPGGDVQAAVNAAGPSGTVILAAAGDYIVHAPVQLLAGQTIIGTTTIGVSFTNDTTTKPGFAIRTPVYAVTNESRLRYDGGTFFHPANGCTIRKVSCAGSLLYGGDVDGLTIDQVVINATSHGEKATCIEAHSFTNLNLGNFLVNTTNGGDDAVFYTYDCGGRIHNFYVDGTNCNDVIHITGQTTKTNVLIDQFTTAHQNANPVEYQQAGANVVVKNGWSSNPGYRNFNTLMGFSLPADQASNTTAEGIVVMADPTPNIANKGQRVGFEEAGRNWSIKHAAVFGVRKAVTITNPASYGSVSDCYFDPALPEALENNSKVTYSNTVDTSVRDKLLARGRPGAMFDVADFDQLGSTSTPVVTTPTPAPAAFKIAATPTKDGERSAVDIAWSNVPAGADDVTAVVSSASGEPVASATWDAAQGHIVIDVPSAWGLVAHADALKPASGNYAVLASSSPVTFNAMSTGDSSFLATTQPAATAKPTTQSVATTIPMQLTIGGTVTNWTLSLSTQIDSTGKNATTVMTAPPLLAK